LGQKFAIMKIKKRFSKKNILSQMLFLQRKHPPKKRKIFFETFAQKIITIAYNMKRYLRFLYFHIWSIAKFG
jgi:hypothetical protein